MAVLIEGISIVVQNSIVDQKYPGGLRQYRRDDPNRSFCSDGLLCRVGFLYPPDVKEFIERLKANGLRFLAGGRFEEIALVDEKQGVTAECRWLEFDRHPNGMSYAFRPGTDPGVIAVPAGWSQDRMGSRSGSARGDKTGHMLFLRSDGGADVYLNRRTGREVRVDRGTGAEQERMLN